MINFKKGFTLAELLIVIAIILILLAIALPEFNNIRDRQILNSATADVVSAIREASSRTRASLDSSSYGVYFDTNNNQLIIFKTNIYDPNSADNEIIELLNPVILSNVELTDGAQSFYFERLTGFPSKNGIIEISLNSYKKTVIIDKTGRININ